MNYHGTTISCNGVGILFTGPPGCGKSTLAYQLIEKGAMLVADDQTLLQFENGEWIARCPEPIKGLMHLRDSGFIHPASTAFAPIKLVIQSNQPDGSLSQAPTLKNIPVLIMDLKELGNADFISKYLSSNNNTL